MSRVDVLNVHLFVQYGISGSALHLVERIVSVAPLRTPPRHWRRLAAGRCTCSVRSFSPCGVGGPDGLISWETDYLICVNCFEC